GYETTLNRRTLAVTGLNALTDHVRVERAVTPYVQWTEVRGWPNQNVAATAVSYYDYEFPEGVAYKYRVREYDVAGVQLAATEYAVSAVSFDGAWLKVPAAPFLNLPVVIADRADVTNRSRGGLLDVKGRTDPILIGGVRASVSYTLQVLTETAAEEQNLEYALATGDAVFLHLPADERTVPGGYFAVGDVTRNSTLRRSPRRLWSLPLTRVVAPGPDVAGAAYTWASVLAEYATWADVIAANATWADLLARTGSPADVIVS
ncbi:MAG TPA: hypothetical protein VIQ30_26035, partial [Pseudonocardia sp.]